MKTAHLDSKLCCFVFDIYCITRTRVNYSHESQPISSGLAAAGLSIGVFVGWLTGAGAAVLFGAPLSTFLSTVDFSMLLAPSDLR